MFNQFKTSLYSFFKSHLILSSTQYDTYQYVVKPGSLTLVSVLPFQKELVWVLQN